ncbi:MAG: hypothetical protein WCO09_04505 [bacterium]
MKTNLIAQGPLRPFQIIIDHKIGYGSNSSVITRKGLVSLVTKYLKERAANGLPFLSGAVISGDRCYAWPTVKGGAVAENEPVSIYTGDASLQYHPNLSDADVLAILNDMAAMLAEKLQQSRIFLSYMDKMYVFQ